MPLRLRTACNSIGPIHEVPAQRAILALVRRQTAGRMVFSASGPVIITAVVMLRTRSRWQTATEALRTRLEAARLPIEAHVYDQADSADLPAPVRRYLRSVLTHGQPLVTAVSLKHTGTFNLGERVERWKPFTSDQRVVIRRPGFDWDGRIVAMPGLPVRVHDAYVAGEGILEAAVCGLVRIAYIRGSGDIARDELLRFLAEAVWYPTALLPSQGVLWEAEDERAAQATLKDGDITATLLFRFGEQGLVEQVCTDVRGRRVGSQTVPTAWQGRFWNYETRSGMCVPLDGEVAWLLPGGTKPYWRGRISRLDYEFAMPTS